MKLGFRGAVLRMTAMALIFSGCASGWRELTQEERRTGSFVFLYIDTTEMDGNLARVIMRQVKAGEQATTWGFNIEDDRYIWFDGLARGNYMLDNYGGPGGFKACGMYWCSNTHYTYRFPKQGSGFRLQEQGVHFLGAFRHVPIEGEGFFDPDKFELERIKEPSEKEILGAILPLVRKEGSPLLPMIERYYRGLK